MRSVKKPFLLRSKAFRWWLLAGLVLLAISLVKVLMIFRQGFDLGDGSTFYMFSHYLSQGEVIYKDFIHFRTPGSYFLWSMILDMWGGGVAAIKFALHLETGVLYQIALFLSLGFLFKWKRLGLVFVITLLSIMLPGYLQLRAGLGLLAVVLYIRSEQSETKKRWWLFATGVVTALAFTFGQEAAVVSIATIGVYELSKLIMRTDNFVGIMRRAGVFIGGFAIGVAPLLIYVGAFSNFLNFIYYTLYYAFIVQPTGMDVPFPSLNYASIIYYLPFVVIALSLAVFHLTRTTATKREDSAFLVVVLFTLFRLITMLGRTDMGHLIYVLPELLLLIGWAAVRLKENRVARSLSWKSATFIMVNIVGMVGAAYTSNILLLVAAGGAIGLFALNVGPQKKSIERRREVMLLSFLLGGVIALGLHLLLPMYIDQARQVRAGMTGSYKQGKVLYEGLYLDPAEADTILQAKSEITKLNPTVIFSFPIQAYFYSMAPHHATRFLTYEPQTTITEQEETIAELEKTKPGVVVFDPAQAADLSASLYKISDYVLQHYKIEKVITGKRILWVMTPSTESGGTKAIFELYHMTTRNAAAVIQSPDKGLNNAISQSPGTVASFDLNNNDKTIVFSLYSENKQNDSCGEITFKGSNKELSRTKVCDVGTHKELAIPEGATSYSLSVNKPLIWNNVSVTQKVESK